MKFGRIAVGVLLLALVVGILFLQPGNPSPEMDSLRSADGASSEPSEAAGLDLRQDVILRLDYNYSRKILYLTTEKARYQYLFDDKRMSLLERFVPGERYFVNYALAELDLYGRWQGLEIIEYDHYK